MSTPQRKKLVRHHTDMLPQQEEKEREREKRGSPVIKRPPPPQQTPSFSKRHASFDSPREVPLPSHPTGQSSRHMSVFEEDDWTMVPPPAPKLTKEKPKPPPEKQRAAPPSPTTSTVVPPPSSFAKLANTKLKLQPQGDIILPNNRPYSLPETQSYTGRPSPKASPAAPVDRTSSASLPLPMQIPFSTLPRARAAPPSPVLERVPSESPLRPPIQNTHSSSSSSSASSGSLPSALPSRSPTPSPSSNGIVSSASSPPSQPTSAPPSFPSQSRGPAPMPPPELSTSNSGSVASYRPPRTTYTPAPTPPARSSSDDPLFPGPTAITRSSSLRPGSSSSIPPPEPPVVLPSAPDALDLLPRATASGVRNSTASYEPFLSHAPAPVDSWIEVETTAAEYRLIVRLPGFKRDGITLATKKRRILHVVADSWDAGGGHFERRISFGYDADLAQVRAEFDGELLRVIIPRRMPPGAVGR